MPDSVEASTPAYMTVNEISVGKKLPRNFVLKRFFDVVMSLLAIVILSPALLAIALVLKIKHPGVPVLFGNKVVGKQGRSFKMWKYSTMQKDAHLILKEMLAEDESLRAEWEANVKLHCDPRILGGFGGFLRRSSLNELPQLFNVLAGRMSLVGPRPITKEEEDLYLKIGGPSMLARRHAQRPGITGLWQATGRSDVSYEERIQIDNKYLREQSFLLDIKILFWTVGKVLSAKGAF